VSTDDGRVAIGFIGLGAMGVPMVRRLSEAGYDVVGFDLSSEARERVQSNGARVVDHLGGAVDGVSYVILMLPDSGIVSAVLNDDGLRKGLASDAIVIDMSSSEPLVTKGLAVDLASQGVRMIDAPVSGGVKGAVNGTLTVMVGGPSDVVDEARPVLEVFGKVIHAGPIGSGHAVKALNNLLSATHLWITGEAMLAGERFGLEPEVMLSVFNGSSGRSGSTENKWPNFVLTESYDSGFGLRLMLKDMKIAVQLASQEGAACELGADAVSLWAKAAADLPTNADHTEVARWIHDRQGDE
jgi:3-hydroxyisobutyrate dehydrogenase